MRPCVAKGKKKGEPTQRTHADGGGIAKGSPQDEASKAKQGAGSEASKAKGSGVDRASKAKTLGFDFGFDSS